MDGPSFDCLIVGGGPAGLSAALILGRCRRRVLVCDSGRPRNAASHGLHGFLTRDGTPPAELLAIGREQLRPYDTVELREVEVVHAGVARGGGFDCSTADGSRIQAKTLLLATGVVDDLPRFPGAAELYGAGVFHCPYCDGWELRDKAVAAWGPGERGARMAIKLTRWTRDVVLCTDGPAVLSDLERRRLERQKIAVREEPIARLEGREGALARIVFASGPPLERDALFFNTPQRQHSTLAGQLGCQVTDKESVRTGYRECTDIPGLYVAGDASRDVQLAVVAAAEGTMAAFDINEKLMESEVGK